MLLLQQQPVTSLTAILPIALTVWGIGGTQADAIPQNLASQGHETIDGVFVKEQ